MLSLRHVTDGLALSICLRLRGTVPLRHVSHSQYFPIGECSRDYNTKLREGPLGPLSRVPLKGLTSTIAYMMLVGILVFALRIYNNWKNCTAHTVCRMVALVFKLLSRQCCCVKIQEDSLALACAVFRLSTQSRAVACGCDNERVLSCKTLFFCSYKPNITSSARPTENLLLDPLFARKIVDLRLSKSYAG